jgi:hypothetical protein
MLEVFRTKYDAMEYIRYQSGLLPTHLYSVYLLSKHAMKERGFSNRFGVLIEYKA